MSIRTFFKQYRNEVKIFAVAFGVRFVVGALLATGSIGSIMQFPLIGGDSESYISLARGLREHGSFVYHYDVRPNSYEMPGYAVFLATLEIFFGIARTMLMVPVIQYIFAGISAVAVFLIGKNLSPRVAWIAVTLFIFDPAGIFYSSFIVTEPLFIFFFTAALVFLVARVQRPIMTGLLLVLAVYIRAVGIIFVPFFALYYLLSDFSRKKRIQSTLIFCTCVFVLIMPWFVRSRIDFGQWQLTSALSYQFYDAHAPRFYAYMNNVSLNTAKDIFRDQLVAIDPYKEEAMRDDVGSLRHTPYLWRVSLGYIEQHPIRFAVFHVLKTSTFFMSDGLRDIASRMKLISQSSEGVGDLILRGNFVGAWRVLGIVGISLLIFGSTLWTLITISMFVGLFFALRYREWLVVVMVLALVCVSLLAGGAVSHPRYRFSVSPFMFLAAAYGVGALRDRLRHV